MATYTYSQNDTSGVTSERKALFIDYSCGIDESDVEIEFDNWAIERVTSTPRARSRLDRNDFLVGLVHLEHLNDEQLAELHKFFRDEDSIVWIAITRQEDLQNPGFRRLIYEHFYDYFTLPLQNSLDYLKAALGHAYGINLLRDETGAVVEYREETSEMVGSSPQIMRTFEQIRKVASVDAPVLITGDTGTGKEIAARAIHQRSSRKNGPFIAVNCGALPDTLINAELFGYEKGAFTGAYKRKIGRIEAAQQGTIFLDEIGDLPLDLQVNLLRFLEESTIERLGGNESHSIDVRVIAATHVDLAKAVEEGRFREDLYYRLNVLNIHMPPLANREQDIELLARYFFNKFTAEYSTRAQGFSTEAITAMNCHAWPGNIREMINRIRRALVMSDNRMITPEDLGLTTGSSYVNNVLSLDDARNHAEEMAVKSCLSHTHNNISKAARLLGVSRVTLYRLMDKYAIR